MPSTPGLLRGDLHSTVTSMLEAMKALLSWPREESTRVGDAFAKRIKTMEPGRMTWRDS